MTESLAVGRQSATGTSATGPSRVSAVGTSSSLQSSAADCGRSGKRAGTGATTKPATAGNNVQAMDEMITNDARRVIRQLEILGGSLQQMHVVSALLSALTEPADALSSGPMAGLTGAPRRPSWDGAGDVLNPAAAFKQRQLGNPLMGTSNSSISSMGSRLSTPGSSERVDPLAVKRFRALLQTLLAPGEPVSPLVPRRPLQNGDNASSEGSSISPQRRAELARVDDIVAAFLEQKTKEDALLAFEAELAKPPPTATMSIMTSILTEELLEEEEEEEGDGEDGEGISSEKVAEESVGGDAVGEMEGAPAPSRESLSAELAKEAEAARGARARSAGGGDNSELESLPDSSASAAATRARSKLEAIESGDSLEDLRRAVQEGAAELATFLREEFPNLCDSCIKILDDGDGSRSAFTPALGGAPGVPGVSVTGGPGAKSAPFGARSGNTLGSLPQNKETASFRQLFAHLNSATTEVLMMSAEQHNSRKGFEEDVRERCARAESDAAALERTMNELKEQYDAEFASRKEQIDSLQKQIDDVNEAARQKSETLHAEKDERSSQDRKAFEKRAAEAAAKRKDLTDTTGYRRDEYKRTEGDLRKKKAKTEQEVLNWVEKYDLEMGERHAALVKEQTELRAVNEELDELAADTVRLTAKHDEVLAPKRAREAELLRMNTVADKFEANAKIIQRAWRRNRAREKAKKAAKRGGKGAKGKRAARK